MIIFCDVFIVLITHRHSRGFSEMLHEVKKNKEEGKYVVGKFYLWFKFYYHALSYPNTKENMI